jgi:hypothetical protein
MSAIPKLLLASVLALVGCDGSSAVKEPIPDSGSANTDSGVITDGGTEAAPSDCYLDPKTHFEIINACTDAAKITKNPTLPRLQPDGGLPPLN